MVSQVFYPDQESTSQLLSSLLETLSARGHDYAVLTGFPGDQALQASCSRDGNWRGIRIRRGGLRLNYKRSLLTRAAGYGSYCLWLMWRLIFCTPPSVRVLVVTNPPFAPVLVHWCSLLRRWSYDVILHDIYPDGLVAVGKLSDRSLIANVWRWLNRLALGAAQQVFVIGRDMAQLCQERYGLEVTRVHYIPHWSPVPFTKRTTAECTQLWRRLGFRDEFVVQYSGNMGLWHDMECIVRAAEMLRDEPRIKFLMIGRGRRRVAAEQLSHDLGLNNMLWLPYQPQDQLTDSLACCHAALISQRAGLAGVAVPCKIYGILASGRVVLAQVPVESEVALVLAEEDCGITTAPGDAHALAEAIRSLAGDRKAAENMGLRGFQAYQSKYTVQVAADTFERILHADVASHRATP